ncbi:MAG TPA: hypothetical protein VMW19_10915 [Myxococcota bacterium]|nr:hypothetical protein [Myxococcota bacterium]
MRRRFGRRRGGRSENENGAALDAEHWLARLAESGVTGPARFEALALDGVSPTAAVLGASPEGDSLLGFSPHDAGDALFGALALAQARAAESGFDGTAFAVAPVWSDAARRRLGLLRALPYRVRALAASALADEPGSVTPAPASRDLAVAPEPIAASIERADERALFGRALIGLQGLAAKHGGSVRGVGRRAELVLFARRAACIDAGESGLRLLIDPPDRVQLDLTPDTLASALDRLEGSLRRQLSDRRVRTSEEGQRASLLRVLERAASLRRAVLWPSTGGEPSRIDWAGVGTSGDAVVAAARERLTLVALGEIVDAALDATAQLGAWLPDGPVPLRGGTPRLVLASSQFDPAALHVLGALALSIDVYEVHTRRSGELELERRESQQAPPISARSETRPARVSPPARAEVVAPASAGPTAQEEAPARPTQRFERFDAFTDDDDGDVAPREPRAPREEAPQAGEAADEESGSRFEEVSLFDLEDESPGTPSPGGARRRRRGGRRRGRRGRGNGGGAYSGEGSPARESEREEPARAEAPRASRESREAPRDDDEIDDEASLELAEAPELEEPVPVPAFEEEEGEEREEEEEEESGEERERELRRRARLAKTVERVAAPEPVRVPRRRAAFVAHADRVSVLTAVLLARDVRLVEGFWVYPQQDLMTFFRSIATDLREETPIFVIGFAASPPARDTIQAAALYRGRLQWFDHHAWPPEDVVALREAIGVDCVHIEPGADCSLPLVISERTRRSRFSDKLVDLITGRFSQHDYERWGRHWWHRAGEVASRRGERRGDVEALLVGRPSELARHAASLPPPPPPEELAYVASRDFRLVHFGGYTLVVVDVPSELDLHLTARIARERYEAQLSLAYRPGGELLILGGDESRARRELDLSGMAAHLASKHEWIRALPDGDHVARMLVRGLTGDPARLEEVIAEVAMGRSIVEG